MFSDIVGYTALMGENEDLAFRLVKENTKIHQQIIKNHNGRLIKRTWRRRTLRLFKLYRCYKSSARPSGTLFKFQSTQAKDWNTLWGGDFGPKRYFWGCCQYSFKTSDTRTARFCFFSKEIQKNLETGSNLSSISLGHFG